MPYRTDDPLEDFHRHEAELEELYERWRRRRPRCSECDCHIETESAYYINDEWICEECMERYRKDIGDEL